MSQLPIGNKQGKKGQEGKKVCCCCSKPVYVKSTKGNSRGIRGSKLYDKDSIVIEKILDTDFICINCGRMNDEVAQQNIQLNLPVEDEPINNVDFMLNTLKNMSFEEKKSFYEQSEPILINHALIQLSMKQQTDSIKVKGFIKDHELSGELKYALLPNPGNRTTQLVAWIPICDKDYKDVSRTIKNQRKKIIKDISIITKSQPLVHSNQKLNEPQCLSISTSKAIRNKIRDSYKSFNPDIQSSMLTSEQKINKYIKEHIFKWNFESGILPIRVTKTRTVNDVDEHGRIRKTSGGKNKKKTITYEVDENIEYARVKADDLILFVKEYVSKTQDLLPNEDPRLRNCFVVAGDNGAGLTTFGIILTCRKSSQSRHSFIPFGIMNAKDSYEYINLCFSPQLEVLANYNFKKDGLDMLVGGDFMCMGSLFGIKGPTCLYPIPFCTWYSRGKSNTCQPRDYDQHINSVDNKDEQYSAVKLPLLRNFGFGIDQIRVVPMPLHLLLGIGSFYEEYLENQFESMGMKQEYDYIISSIKTSQGLIDGASRSQILALCGEEVKRLVNDDTQSKLIKLVPSNEASRDKLIKTINSQSKIINQLFHFLLNKKSFDDIDIQNLQSVINEYETSSKEYMKGKRKPKVHVLIKHVIPFIRYWRNLGNLSEQAMESYHAEMKRVVKRYKNQSNKMKEILLFTLKSILIENSAEVVMQKVPCSERICPSCQLPNKKNSEGKSCSCPHKKQKKQKQGMNYNNVACLIESLIEAREREDAQEEIEEFNIEIENEQAEDETNDEEDESDDEEGETNDVVEDESDDEEGETIDEEDETDEEEETDDEEEKEMKTNGNGNTRKRNKQEDCIEHMNVKKR